jgi:hypothetical protein
MFHQLFVAEEATSANSAEDHALITMEEDFLTINVTMGVMKIIVNISHHRIVLIFIRTIISVVEVLNANLMLGAFRKI